MKLVKLKGHKNDTGLILFFITIALVILFFFIVNNYVDEDLFKSKDSLNIENIDTLKDTTIIKEL